MGSGDSRGRIDPRSPAAIATAEGEHAREAAWAAERAAEAAELAQHARNRAVEAAEKAFNAANQAAQTAGGTLDAGEPFTVDYDSRDRRLFAQEFVTQLKRLGDGTAKELYSKGIALFAAQPTIREIDDVGRIAQRYGWVKSDGDTWTVTDAGAALPRPPSLGLGQVLTRLVRVANPVGDNAADWLPRLALVAGATAGAAAVQELTTLDAIRALAVAVLLISIAVQFHGEYRITESFRKWKPDGASGPSTRNDFHRSYWRLGWAAAFDLLIVTAFALLIYWYAFSAPSALDAGPLTHPWVFTVVMMAVALGIAGGVLQFTWRNGRKKYLRELGLDTTAVPRSRPQQAAHKQAAPIA